ncbi:NUDIX hydrolase [Haloarchaeobius amylolyticus]|uniref:NUDIX hydrolase n=1 Tax=Haloarchaeobius amylolyticus TaxID=1198296 RepID=UPI00227216A1|nr:NUDIX hydrolase [Haloarchaeobius amylolyticus]
MVWVLHGDAPDYCPRCGEPLTRRDTDDGPRPHCSDCGVTIYHNASVMARTAVLDGDRVLLIERGAADDIGAWATPGGYVEAGERARQAAARELEEETGLAAAPGALTLVCDGFLDYGSGETDVALVYAVASTETTGTIQAASDAADARWWTRAEIAAELTDEEGHLRAVGVDTLLGLLDGSGEALRK